MNEYYENKKESFVVNNENIGKLCFVNDKYDLICLMGVIVLILPGIRRFIKRWMLFRSFKANGTNRYIRTQLRHEDCGVLIETTFALNARRVINTFYRLTKLKWWIFHNEIQLDTLTIRKKILNEQVRKLQPIGLFDIIQSTGRLEDELGYQCNEHQIVAELGYKMIDADQEKFEELMKYLNLPYTSLIDLLDSDGGKNTWNKYKYEWIGEIHIYQYKFHEI